MWLISPLGKYMALNLNKFEFHLPKNTLCQVRLKLTIRFWRRIFPKVIFTNFTLLISSPVRQRTMPVVERNWLSNTQACYVPSFVECGPVKKKKKKKKKKLSMYFHYLAIIFLWKRTWPFIWTNLNRLHLGILYVV